MRSLLPVVWISRLRAGDRRRPGVITDFAQRERLGVAGPALHAAQPGQAQEDLVVPPVAAMLGREALVQQLDLAPRSCSADSGKYTDGRPRSPSHFGIS